MFFDAEYGIVNITSSGNVTDTVSGNTDEIQAALFLRNKMSWLEGLHKLQFAAYPLTGIMYLWGRMDRKNDKEKGLKNESKWYFTSGSFAAVPIWNRMFFERSV